MAVYNWNLTKTATMTPDTNVLVVETKENGHTGCRWKNILEIICIWSFVNAVQFSPDVYEKFLLWLQYAFVLCMLVCSHKESFPGSSFGVVAYCWMALKAVFIKLVFTVTWYNGHYTLIGVALLELLQLSIYDEIRTRRITREIHVGNLFEKDVQHQNQTEVVNENTNRRRLSGVLRHAIKVKIVFICIVLLYIVAPCKLYMLLANTPSLMFAVIIIFTHIDFFSEKSLIDFILYCCVIFKYLFYLKYVFTLHITPELKFVIISIIEYLQLHISHRVKEWLCDTGLVKCQVCYDSLVGTHENSKQGRIQSELSFIEELFFFCIFIYIMLHRGIWGVVTVRDIFLVASTLLVIAYSTCFLITNKSLLSLKYSHVFCVNLSKCLLFVGLWYWHILLKCLILLSLVELLQVRVLGYHILQKKAAPAPELCECGRYSKCIICLVWYIMPYIYSVDVWRVTSYVTCVAVSRVTSYITCVDVSRVTSYMHFIDVWYIYNNYQRSRLKDRDNSEVV